MSHPDPFYDEENTMDFDPNYDDHDDFFRDDVDELRGREVESDDFDDYSPEFDYDDWDDSMDGDHESALGSAGWGEDEYYGYYGEDY